MSINTTSRNARTEEDGFRCGQQVRIIGDTFRNYYHVVAIETRTERDGNRLIGGDSRVVLATLNGNLRRVSFLDIDTDLTAWTEADSRVVGRRNTRRAAADRAKKIAASPKPLDVSGLTAIVKFIRGTQEWKRPSTIERIARLRNFDAEWLTALVAAC